MPILDISIKRLRYSAYKFRLQDKWIYLSPGQHKFRNSIFTTFQTETFYFSWFLIVVTYTQDMFKGLLRYFLFENSWNASKIKERCSLKTRSDLEMDNSPKQIVVKSKSMALRVGTPQILILVSEPHVIFLRTPPPPSNQFCTYILSATLNKWHILIWPHCLANWPVLSTDGHCFEARFNTFKVYRPF